MRNRIKEFKYLKKDQLIPNTKNWRLHPQHQREALQGILDEVGVAGAVIAVPEGDRFRIIDGHLRHEEIVGDVPTLILDLNEDEERKLLAVFDPIGEMAEQDEDNLKEIISQIDFQNFALKELIASLEPDEKKPGSGEGEKSLHDNAVQLAPGREYVLIMAEDLEQWEGMKLHFGLKMVKTARGSKLKSMEQIGCERVIPWKEYLNRVGVNHIQRPTQSGQIP